MNDGKVHHSSWTCDGREGLLQHYKVDDLGKCSTIQILIHTDGG